MDFHTYSVDDAINKLNSNKDKGLSDALVDKNKSLYGLNLITRKKKQSIISKIFSALKEPMLLILLFGFVLAFGVNLGKYLKTGYGDFAECFGILFAVILSVCITLFMEGSSEKAFEMLNKLYDNVKVKVIRNGNVVSISQKEVVVGDILLIESGDKIVADGRLIESDLLTIDESALTGESVSVEKNHDQKFDINTPLAERKNMVYSGTFATSGMGKILVTAVGDNTEIGCIASNITEKEQGQTPLQTKLAKLSKIITIIGASCAILVFILSIIKLYVTGNFTFNNVQELFVSCIVLIVAAVPEGLPTIVAVSLALNMIKLAKGNALIKKMTATETAGAVSVICSDKTGTLTQNKMSVVSVCLNNFCYSPEKIKIDLINQNFVINSTADLVGFKKNKPILKGNGTECALIESYLKNQGKTNFLGLRNSCEVVERVPFSSENKLMSTTIKFGEGFRKLVKGAPEYVLKLCDLTDSQVQKIFSLMEKHQKKSYRILCFAHLDYSNKKDDVKKLIYDGYVCIADPIRSEVKKAVLDCKRAGIDVKILTGDNLSTAYAIAKELDIVKDESGVINGKEIEKMNDQTLKKFLPKISVIARSTPAIKLRIVKLLKSMGEVVAVTGDGINDAPAIKHADVGFAMGETGADITKEVADVVLLDDSFSNVVKSIAFGRTVYRNLQRFILFQLSVNLSALFFITVCAILGVQSPFNTLQLLWINVIMDGPPALTLGLESMDSFVMNLNPIKRKSGIVNLKMLMRIIFNGLYVGIVMVMQYLFNFLSVKDGEMLGVTFTLFVLFQLFNAFNCRELGAESIFRSISKNKIMLLTFGCVFLVHLFIVQVTPWIFGIQPMCFLSWIKCVGTCLSILVVSEIYKLIYRLIKGISKEKNIKFVKKRPKNYFANK